MQLSIISKVALFNFFKLIVSTKEGLEVVHGPDLVTRALAPEIGGSRNSIYSSNRYRRDEQCSSRYMSGWKWR